MILGDQLVGGPVVFHPLFYLLSHKLTDKVIGFPVNQYLFVVANPEAEPRLSI